MGPHLARTTHIRGFPQLNQNQIELIELDCMILGIENIKLCMTSKLPIIKNKLPYTNGINCKEMFTVNSKQTSM